MSSTSEPESDRAVPRASALLESFRGVGYTPWSAVADLVDNSITAGARRVWIEFVWKGASSYVRVLDDGSGMEEKSLIDAMRPGSRNPTERRSTNDLGRFGLGLKTASLSQCRALTVVTRRASRTIARRWDLDYVALKDDWLLLVGPPEEAGEASKIPSGLTSGTLVLWTKLDRLVGKAGIDDPSAQARFREVIRHVEWHLAMTFHRFLEAPRPRLELYVNGNRVLAWDPFMESHPATSPTPIERIRFSGGVVEVRGFVLPHKDKLTPEQLELGGGPEGWLAHQGFFVYRNRRLLLSGGWLPLKSGRPWARDEIHRLARIRLDIPNSFDDDWKIDIRKSTATPPADLRSRLRDLAERVRADAREVLAYRGGRATRSAPSAVNRAWTSMQTKDGPSYRIDRAHPSVRRVLDEAGGMRMAVEEMLRVIEVTVPVQRIWLDTAESGDVPVPQSAGQLDSEISSSLHSMYSYLVHDLRLTAQEARRRLQLIEPFNQHPDAVRALPDIQ